MTFKEPEAAKKACEDATPMINGRRANCNLASLGARRPRSAASSTPPHQGIFNPYNQNSKVQNAKKVIFVNFNFMEVLNYDVFCRLGSNGGSRPTSAAPTSHVQWYYPAGTPAPPFHHQHHQAVPFYGYASFS